MTRTVFLLASALLFLATVRSNAQEDSHHRAAVEFIETIQLQNMVAKMYESMHDGMLASEPQLVAFDSVLRVFLRQNLSWENLKNDIADLYAGAFTEQELRQLTAFYKTDLGQKLLRTNPELSRKTSALGQRRVQEHADDLKPMILNEMERLRKENEAGAAK